MDEEKEIHFEFSDQARGEIQRAADDTPNFMDRFHDALKNAAEEALAGGGPHLKHINEETILEALDTLEGQNLTKLDIFHQGKLGNNPEHDAYIFYFGKTLLYLVDPMIIDHNHNQDQVLRLNPEQSPLLTDSTVTQAQRQDNFEHLRLEKAGAAYTIRGRIFIADILPDDFNPA